MSFRECIFSANWQNQWLPEETKGTVLLESAEQLMNFSKGEVRDEYIYTVTCSFCDGPMIPMLEKRMFLYLVVFVGRLVCVFGCGMLLLLSS